MDRTEIQSIMDKYPDEEVIKLFGACLLELMERPQVATMGQGEGSSPGSSEKLVELRQELHKHVKDVPHTALSEGSAQVHPCRCAPCATDRKNGLAESYKMGQKALLKTFDQAAAARDVLVEAVRKHQNGQPAKAGIPADALATIMAE